LYIIAIFYFISLGAIKMDATSQQANELSTQKIALQAKFKAHTDANGFSYEEWLNPPAGSFYESYKKDLAAIDEKIAPPLAYQA
jgi:hypothetical protein